MNKHKFLFSICILLLIFVVAIPKKMEVIKISVVNAIGENSLPQEKVKELFVISKEYYKTQLNLDLRIIKYRKRQNRYLQDLSFSRRTAVLRKWEKYFLRRGEADPNIIKMVLMNPVKVDGTYWLAGISNGICSYRSMNPVAYSNGELYNAEGILRFLQSIVAFLHETLHLLGANHDNNLPPTIMNADALPYVEEYGVLLPSKHTKKEIRKCLH